MPRAAAGLLVVVLMVGSGGGCTSAARPIPLAEALRTMQPRAVWQGFYDLTRVPRPSHQEAKATAFVAEFGRRLGLETVIDRVGNVLIRKPATPEMAGRAGVVLQAHLDMVAQQASGSPIAFATDPTTAVVEDGWVHAEGTTLGADDGIGVALAMALLQARDVVHGPLEALFTVNEEDGTTGINALAPDALRGRLYIGLDNEVEGQFLISSAGGVNVGAQAHYAEVATPAGMTGFGVSIDGLMGGHSGIDINKGRGSAHQLMARLLVDAPAELDVHFAELVGGDVRNATPRKTTALVAVPASKGDAFRGYVTEFAKTVASELAQTDPGVKVTASPAQLPARVMDRVAQAALVGAVDAAPQGVYAMSKDIPGLVETSGNLGVLAIRAGHFNAGVLVRSALDSERDAEAQRFVAVFAQAGAAVTLGESYPSWPPNPDSPLLSLMKTVYNEGFHTQPVVSAVHAGLETSVAGSKYSEMDMISVGPTIHNVHSPDERLEAASVARVYDLLTGTLRAVK